MTGFQPLYEIICDVYDRLGTARRHKQFACTIGACGFPTKETELAFPVTRPGPTARPAQGRNRSTDRPSSTATVDVRTGGFRHRLGSAGAANATRRRRT